MCKVQWLSMHAHVIGWLWDINSGESIMKMLFSASKCAFYAAAWEESYRAAGNWPNDLIVLSDSQYKEFSKQPPPDKLLGVENGKPAWVSQPQLTENEIIAKNVSKKMQLLAEAKSVISIWQTRLLVDRICEKDKAKLYAWLDYIDALEAMDTSETGSINWPDLPVA